MIPSNKSHKNKTKIMFKKRINNAIIPRKSLPHYRTLKHSDIFLYYNEKKDIWQQVLISPNGKLLIVSYETKESKLIRSKRIQLSCAVNTKCDKARSPGQAAVHFCEQHADYQHFIYICDIEGGCGRRFRRPRDLNRHVCNDSLIYQCQICWKWVSKNQEFTHKCRKKVGGIKKK